MICLLDLRSILVHGMGKDSLRRQRWSGSGCRVSAGHRIIRSGGAVEAGVEESVDAVQQSVERRPVAITEGFAGGPLVAQDADRGRVRGPIG